MINLISACENAVDPGDDDERNGGLQFGHFLSGNWQTALSSWGSIGTTTACLTLLAAVFKIRATAAITRSITGYEGGLLIDAYIQEIVQQLLEAWNLELATGKVSTLHIVIQKQANCSLGHVSWQGPDHA